MLRVLVGLVVDEIPATVIVTESLTPEATEDDADDSVVDDPWREAVDEEGQRFIKLSKSTEPNPDASS